MLLLEAITLTAILLAQIQRSLNDFDEKEEDDMRERDDHRTAIELTERGKKRRLLEQHMEKRDTTVPAVDITKKDHRLSPLSLIVVTGQVDKLTPASEAALLSSFVAAKAALTATTERSNNKTASILHSKSFQKRDQKLPFKSFQVDAKKSVRRVETVSYRAGRRGLVFQGRRLPTKKHLKSRQVLAVLTLPLKSLSKKKKKKSVRWTNMASIQYFERSEREKLGMIAHYAVIKSARSFRCKHRDETFQRIFQRVEHIVDRLVGKLSMGEIRCIVNDYIQTKLRTGHGSEVLRPFVHLMQWERPTVDTRDDDDADAPALVAEETT